jgi:hypothetical protein
MSIIDEHFQKNECIYEISKELSGRIDRLRINFKECTNICTSLLTFHRLEAELNSHACDSDQGRGIRGRIIMEILNNLNSDGEGRGYHYGNFKIIDDSRIISEGKIFGLTNTGTHHETIFNCERCNELGHMEGTLEGDVLHDDPLLNNCRFFGSYSMKFDHSREFQSSRIDGIVEGVAVCRCRNLE